MTRGLRKRPLIEPEPDIKSVVWNEPQRFPPNGVFVMPQADESQSDVAVISRPLKDEKTGQFLPGNPGGPGRPPVKSLTEVLRQTVNPQALAATLISLAVDDRRTDALMYIYDRLDGRPKQSVDVTADGPSIAVQLLAAIYSSAGVPLPEGTEPPLLPPAPSQ